MSTVQRRMIENSLVVAALLWLAWSWWSFSGPYRWAAIAELKVTGSFGAIITFILSAIIVVALVTGVLTAIELITGKSATPARRPTPEEAKARMDAFFLRGSIVLTAVSLVVTLTCVLGLLRFYQRTELASLDLSATTAVPRGAGLVQLKGFTRKEFLVSITSKSTGDIQSHDSDYMAVVGRDWQPGQPVPAVVAGSPGEGMDYRDFENAAPGTMLPYLLPKGAIQSVHSGFAEYLLEGRGAKVDSHTLFLTTGLNDDRDVMIVVLIFSSMFLLFGAFALRGAMRTAKRSAAVAA